MFRDSSKGQTSFELLIIATLLVVIVLSALRLVPVIGTSTSEIAVLKSEALRVLSEQNKFYYIADIKEPVTTGTHEITIVIGGNPVSPGLRNELQALSQKLVDEEILPDPPQINVEELS